MAQAHQNWGHFVARSKSSLFGCPLCALDDIQSIDEADVRIVLNESIARFETSQYFWSHG